MMWTLARYWSFLVDYVVVIGPTAVLFPTPNKRKRSRKGRRVEHGILGTTLVSYWWHVFHIPTGSETREADKAAWQTTGFPFGRRRSVCGLTP